MEKGYGERSRGGSGLGSFGKTAPGDAHGSEQSSAPEGDSPHPRTPKGGGMGSFGKTGFKADRKERKISSQSAGEEVDGGQGGAEGDGGEGVSTGAGSWGAGWRAVNDSWRATSSSADSCKRATQAARR